MRIRRLAVAYAVAPVGALALVGGLFGPFAGAPSTWFDGGPNPLVGYAVVAGVAYAAGLVLLPVFFILEYWGKRGWLVYVPVASLAGFCLGPALEWPGQISGNWGRYMLCSLAGGLSGVVFSLVVGWRSPRAGGRRRPPGGSQLQYQLGGTLSAIGEIKAKLATHPHIRYAETGDSIEVQPADADGFVVRLHQAPRQCTVSFEGWHEEFQSEAEALDCFAFGLSASCRLRVIYRGESPVSWTVEAFRNGVWSTDSETGLILTPFWRRKHVRYLQNRWLPAA